MKIIIGGSGRLGSYLADYFVRELQDVYLIDKEAERLRHLEADVNMRTFEGSISDFDTLREAGASDADVFVAVTGSEEVNLIGCAMAKSLGARRTIARVDSNCFIDKKNLSVLSSMGVDHVVYPDYLAATRIYDTIENPWTTGIKRLYSNDIILAAVRVTEHAPLAGLQLRDAFGGDRNIHISAMSRRGETIIPGGLDTINEGDVLYATMAGENVSTLLDATGHTYENKGGEVIIVGGSRVAEILAENAKGKFRITIVEKNIERCRKLIRTCPGATIIYGDAAEEDVMAEAGIDRCQAVIWLTENTESNILGSLGDAEAGVPLTIAEVEKARLMPKAEDFGIDAVINKPVITAHAIFQLVLEADNEDDRIFVVPGAEVVRMEVRPGSRLTGKAIMDLGLPTGVTFAARRNSGHGELVTGRTVLSEGDNITVFCLRGSLNKVKKLFK